MDNIEIAGAVNQYHKAQERQKAEEILRLYQQLDDKNQAERLIQLDKKLKKCLTQV